MNIISAIKSRQIFILGMMGINISEDRLLFPLKRQCNSYDSEKAFRFLINFLRDKQNKQVILPFSMKKAVSFIKPHLRNIKFYFSHGKEKLPAGLDCYYFLRKESLFLYRDFLASNLNDLLNIFESEEWILTGFNKDDSSKALSASSFVSSINMQDEIVNLPNGSKIICRGYSNDKEIVNEVKLAYFENHLNNELNHFDKTQPFHFLDLGGHIGSFSMMLTDRLGKIKGDIYEPESDNFNQIKKNIALNNLSHVRVFNEAVSDTDHNGVLYINPEHTGANQLGKKLSYKTQTIDVKVISFETALNKLECEKLDILKIDVEGSEYNCLMPFKEILKKRVKMIIGEAQSSSQYKPELLMRFLKEANFDVKFTGDKDLITFFAINKN